MNFSISYNISLNLKGEIYMKFNTVGFIGCGNMAQAMLGGIVKSKLIASNNIICSNPSPDKLKIVKDKYSINVTDSNIEVAKVSDVIILAVKPYKYNEIISEIQDFIKSDVLIVSIAPGLTIEYLGKCFAKHVKIIRTMPNTPAMVGEGMTAISFNSDVPETEIDDLVILFNSFGKTEIIAEQLMDAIPAISGSSPAYVFMFIEALADGGVLSGIPRQQAYRMAAQAVLGSAKMVLETKSHPALLKDNVCSPGGTTIEAVYTLEKNNFRGAIMSAMESCTEKTKKMSKK